tara:strand:+ start:192 stop:842 length:651 start_codon:yes stop_codon:yes gene_type:complete
VEEKIIKSKQRIVDFGEVNTNSKTVTKMVDLVNVEFEKLDSRFLEPACGDGNFLCEVLSRKMDFVKSKYYKYQVDYEKYSIQACSSIYGIDLLDDNVVDARNRLNEIFNIHYSKNFDDINENVTKSVKKIFELNIVQGDALSFKCGKNMDQSIILPEWSLIDNSLKRRDFAFKDFIAYSPIKEPNLFSELGEKAFVPEPVKDWPLTKYYLVYEFKK